MKKNIEKYVLRNALGDAKLLLTEFYKKINYQGYKIKFSDLKIMVAAFWNKGILYHGNEAFPNHWEFRRWVKNMCYKYEQYPKPFIVLPPDPKYKEMEKTGIPEYKHTPPPPPPSQNPLDKVTTERLHMFMRLCNIFLDPIMVDHIIDCVEIVANKGGEASINDAVELEAEWKKQNP